MIGRVQSARQQSKQQQLYTAGERMRHGNGGYGDSSLIYFPRLTLNRSFLGRVEAHRIVKKPSKPISEWRKGACADCFPSYCRDLLNGFSRGKIPTRWLDLIGYKCLKLSSVFGFKGNFHCASHMADEVVAVQGSSDEILQPD